MAYAYDLLNVEVDGRLARVTVNNPPINLVTVPLFLELAALSKELAADPALTVVVMKSAVPDFFLAHFDVSAILAMPTAEPAERNLEINAFSAMCERFRTMNKVTIAQIEGRVGGGGSELAMSFDMRFGVRGVTRINQMEVPLGILPGATGTQRLPHLVGRGRAAEIILGADDLDAETAERWGYLNRIFERADIDSFVSRLAGRIAAFPPPAVRLAKESINNAHLPPTEGVSLEAYLFQRLIREDSARAAMQRFLEIGGQTREGELEVGDLVTRL